jgi:hypothetical protein
MKSKPTLILERQKCNKGNHNKSIVRDIFEKLNCNENVIRIAPHIFNLKALRTPLSQETPSIVIKFLKFNYHTIITRKLNNNLGTLSWIQVRHLCKQHGF